jgi:cyclopropane-fatty-acyl-phospholipid synthase
MNEPVLTLESGQTEAPAPATKAGWSRKLLLRLLDQLDADALELHLPDGSRANFGASTREELPAVIRVRSEEFFRRVLLHGEIGFGEAFMAGDWDSPDVTRVIRFFLRNAEATPGLASNRRSPLLFNLLRQLSRFRHWLRRNTVENSQRNIAAHYDLSNEFYRLWLDDTLTYSSAYFEAPDQPLRDAQEAKYRRLAERLQLRPGQRVLEIGCGWGGNAIFLARHYGVHVTGITISREQLALGRERVRTAGLEHLVDLQFRDYREVEGSFDAIVSIEMLEAVGHEFLRPYFAQCHRLLKRSGLLGLQVILSPDSRYEAGRKSADWIKKHIFPGGQLPSIPALNAAINHTGDLYLHHLDSFGQHYAQTLRLWRERYHAQLHRVRDLGLDETFIRRWHYYLSYCEGAFATAHINVAQLVYARPNRVYA